MVQRRLNKNPESIKSLNDFDLKGVRNKQFPQKKEMLGNTLLSLSRSP